ncbi:hypothetical protein JCM30471_29210 [Desulfuromonas carbonis]|uniref:caspase family protein n=1 Tax=Desulfuromonas sp. DDH964 TaxID=1823759 RepID=UPI00078EBE05|nr:caspase family protein [Desulfuromonas sp. DDH964]AMV71100.1 hypothetical protein DBW_0715 [Desulfuromonas sp. DDH964]
MRGRVHLLAMLLGCLVLAGCATLEVASVKPQPPDMQIRKKYPVKAALLIPRSTLDLNSMTQLPNSCWGSLEVTKYPFGNSFREILTGTFSQLFDSVEVISGFSADESFDLVIEANLTFLGYKLGCGADPGLFFQADGKVKLYDSQYREIWSGYQGSVKEGIHQSWKGPDQVDTDIGNMLATLAGRLAQELTMSPQLASFLLNRNQHQESYAAVAVRSASPAAVIRSDVDELPTVEPLLDRNAYALVIGIERYRQQLPAADFAVHDAEMVAKYLTGVLGYPEENVVTLTNDHAALGDFVKYFEKWLPNQVESGGKVFVYFSGHGAPDPKSGAAYLVPYDGDPAFIAETGYSLKRMYAALGKLPAAEIIVALDSCFSGAGGRSVIAKGARAITLNLKATAPPPANMTVLAASSGEQMSSTYAEKGHGLFTYYLLKGIKNEDVVAPSGKLRIDDLFAYLQPQVERVARKQFNNEQTPQLIGAGK